MSATSGAQPTPGDPRVLVIGEALVDAVSTPDGRTAEHVGGSPANVAFGLAALGHQVDLATWVGTDERGELISALCDSCGVRITTGSLGAPFTSVAHATLDQFGAATYRFELEWRLAPVPGLREYAHVHTGSIAAVLEPGASAVRQTVRTAHDSATISYDPNVRPSLMGSPDLARRTIEESIAAADVVKVSDEDLAWLRPGEPVDEVMADWTRLGPAVVIVTKGAAGATVRLSGTGEVHETPALQVDVVDTVGAGDSFMAGLLSGLLDADLLGGPHARERLRRASFAAVLPAVERALATAALTVARAGAHAPRRADLEDR